MFRSATFKLTMWYLAIVVAISLIFSGVVYHYASRELATGLHSQTERIYEEYPVFHHNPLVQPLKDLNASDRRILWRLIDFNIIVFIAAGFASYFLARRTLAPIKAVHDQQKRFTADASHELRTPLTALKMESEVALMNKQAGKAELRETLESNLEEAAKMEVLINNLLRLSKLDAGQIATHFHKLTALAVAEEAVEHIAKTGRQRHIVIDNRVAKLSFTGDQDSLVQLLVVLLDNAIKYSPEHSKIILTSADHNDYITITIEDRGKGIPPEALPHVFDRFYRADKARTASAEQGYGLGLSIAKLIADIHHGSIVLQSQVGKGTSAVVTLPKGLDS